MLYWHVSRSLEGGLTSPQLHILKIIFLSRPLTNQTSHYCGSQSGAVVVRSDSQQQSGMETTPSATRHQVPPKCLWCSPSRARVRWYIYDIYDIYIYTLLTLATRDSSGSSLGSLLKSRNSNVQQQQFVACSLRDNEHWTISMSETLRIVWRVQNRSFVS